MDLNYGGVGNLCNKLNKERLHLVRDSYRAVEVLIPCKQSLLLSRLRVVRHFFWGIVERAKRERAWKSPTRERRDAAFFSLPAASRLSRLGWYSRALAFRSLARSTIPEEKWGTTRSLPFVSRGEKEALTESHQAFEVAAARTSGLD